MLVAFQLCVVRIVATDVIALVIPLCQKRMLTLCKGWMFDDCPSGGTLTAARLHRYPSIRRGSPSVATDLAMPASWLIAVGYYSIRSAQGSICLVVPLSCSPWSHNGQAVVLAHLAAAALRAACAPASVADCCCPVMQVAVWTSITSPCHFPIAEWLDHNIAQVSISSMVPLPLQSWTEEADVWPCLLCFLALIWVSTQNLMLQPPACMQTIRCRKGSLQHAVTISRLPHIHTQTWEACANTHAVHTSISCSASNIAKSECCNCLPVIEA